MLRGRALGGTALGLGLPARLGAVGLVRRGARLAVTRGGARAACAARARALLAVRRVVDPDPVVALAVALVGGGAGAARGSLPRRGARGPGARRVRGGSGAGG